MTCTKFYQMVDIPLPFWKNEKSRQFVLKVAYIHARYFCLVFSITKDNENNLECILLDHLVDFAYATLSQEQIPKFYPPILGGSTVKRYHL